MKAIIIIAFALLSILSRADEARKYFTDEELSKMPKKNLVELVSCYQKMVKYDENVISASKNVVDANNKLNEVLASYKKSASKFNELCEYYKRLYETSAALLEKWQELLFSEWAADNRSLEYVPEFARARYRNYLIKLKSTPKK